MSNRRRPARANTYRSGYLQSVAWFTRRSRWFRNEAAINGAVRCAVCCGRGTTRTLELHHLSYDGVAFVDGQWVANEAHADLVAAHREHHALIHQLIDRDPVLRDHRSRRAANTEALRRLRRRLAQNLRAAFGLAA